jgi:hypothetical protein
MLPCSGNLRPQACYRRRLAYRQLPGLSEGPMGVPAAVESVQPLSTHLEVLGRPAMHRRVPAPVHDPSTSRLHTLPSVLARNQVRVSQWE